jgi:hypothetical protein
MSRIQIALMLRCRAAWLGANRQSMIPKKPAPDLIRGGRRFSDNIMLKRKI